MTIDLRGLGYVVYDVTDIAAWRELTVDAFGMMPAGGPPAAEPDGTLWLRLDERSWRIAVQPADRDRQVAAGWEVADDVALSAAVTHLEAHGVAVKAADHRLRTRRGVSGLAFFDDPWGNHHEIYWGQTVEEEPFRSPVGVQEFLTGPLGIGHVFYAVASAPEAEAFYRDAMGFRLTDRFAWGPNTVVFMRATARHHSIGFFDLPMPPGPNHLMLEVSRLEDLGKAYDRVMDLQIPIVNTLGQHFNDPTLSFYVQNPSGFNMELGWQALQVDDATWVARTYTGRGELWGHRGDMMDDIADAKVESR
ncbi:VOC family protein [Mycobacterium asiaticum]|uniref:VOC family protein n=1 Tax=Mycobacterium asiaticum TaxID=1790 RepID=UPI0009BF9C30|nr:VOC family protein [Mycobacterium asiaticum]